MNKLIATLIVGAFSAAAFAATPAPASTDAKPVEATAPVKKAAHKKVKITHAKKAKTDGVAAAGSLGLQHRVAAGPVRHGLRHLRPL